MIIIIIIILYYPKLVNDFVYDLRAFLVGQWKQQNIKKNKNVTAIYVRLDEANIFW